MHRAASGAQQDLDQRLRDALIPLEHFVNARCGPLWQFPGLIAPLQALPSPCVAQTQRTVCNEPMRLDLVAYIWPVYSKSTHIFLQFIINSSQDISLRPLS